MRTTVVVLSLLVATGCFKKKRATPQAQPAALPYYYYAPPPVTPAPAPETKAALPKNAADEPDAGETPATSFAPRATKREALVRYAISVPDDYKPAGEVLELSLRGPDGKIAWACRRRAPLDEGHSVDWCGPLDAGKLRLGEQRVSVTLSGTVQDALQQSFPYTARSVASTSMWHWRTARSGELVVSRINDAHKEVTLSRRRMSWMGGGPLRYNLVNGSSSLTIIRRRRARRAQRAADAARQAQLHRAFARPGVHRGARRRQGGPGARAQVEEGHFVGALRPLDKAEYRFVFRYTTTPPRDGSRSALVDVYELRDAFAIGTDAKVTERPDWGIECDPPYYIDERGLRRVKRDCLDWGY